MEELSKTYTVAHSPDGWRVSFSTGIAPGFGLEPHYQLFEVIDRVQKLYPEYWPRLNDSQLADYTLQLKDWLDENPGSVSEAVNALMRCVPPELRASEKVVLKEVAKQTFQNDLGVTALIEELKNAKAVNEIPTDVGTRGREHRLSVDDQAREIEKLIGQTADLREGLIEPAKNLQTPSAGFDRSDIVEGLATLHHRLSDLRAHVDIANREVVLAKMIGSAESGRGRNGGCSRLVSGSTRGVQAVRTAERRGLGR